jgi:hypothetical protein
VGNHEGLYLFHANGEVEIKHTGEELVLPGTLAWKQYHGQWSGDTVVAI